MAQPSQVSGPAVFSCTGGRGFGRRSRRLRSAGLRIVACGYHGLMMHSHSLVYAAIDLVCSLSRSCTRMRHRAGRVNTAMDVTAMNMPPGVVTIWFSAVNGCTVGFAVRRFSGHAGLSWSSGEGDSPTIARRHRPSDDGGRYECCSSPCCFECDDYAACPNPQG